MGLFAPTDACLRGGRGDPACRIWSLRKRLDFEAKTRKSASYIGRTKTTATESCRPDTTNIISTHTHDGTLTDSCAPIRTRSRAHNGIADRHDLVRLWQGQ